MSGSWKRALTTTFGTSGMQAKICAGTITFAAALVIALLAYPSTASADSCDGQYKFVLNNQAAVVGRYSCGGSHANILAGQTRTCCGAPFTDLRVHMGKYTGVSEQRVPAGCDHSRTQYVWSKFYGTTLKVGLHTECRNR